MESTQQHVKIVVRSGPADFVSLLHHSTHTDINVHHIPNYTHHSKFLSEVLNIVMCGNHHTSKSLYAYPKNVIIKIGDWNKPYLKKESKMHNPLIFIVGILSVGSMVAAAIQAFYYMPSMAVPLTIMATVSLCVFCGYLFFENWIHGENDHD